MNSSRSECGRLNQALRRMVRYGYGKDAKAIANAVRNLESLTVPELARSRELLLKALHRRGPFAPERDFQIPRLCRPAIWS